MVGPISDGSYQNKFMCNKIMLKDHGIRKMIKHHFAILKEVKEDGITDLLKEIIYY